MLYRYAIKVYLHRRCMSDTVKISILHTDTFIAVCTYHAHIHIYIYIYIYTFIHTVDTYNIFIHTVDT